MRTRLLCGAACLMLLVAACGGGEPPRPTRTPWPTPGRGDPIIRIDAPHDQSSVQENAHTIVVRVENFKLVDKIGKKNKKGQGHLIYYSGIDAEEIPAEPGESAIPEDGVYHVTEKPYYVWPDVEQDRTYMWIVQLVNNDNSTLDVPIIKGVRITIKGVYDADATPPADED